MYKPPFDITSEMLHLISEISEQVGIINMRLGENAPSPHLRKKSQIKTIHSSLAIEHNSLSLKQVTDIIDGKRVLGAPDEIQEVKNAIGKPDESAIVVTCILEEGVAADQ